MADENATTDEAAKAAAEAEAAAKAEAATKAAAEAAAKAEEEKNWDYERGMATINKLRDEVKAAKAEGKRAAELEKKLKEYEDAQLSEKEKLEKKIADYEARESDRAEREQALRLRLAAHNLQPTLGIADVDLALAALDRNAVEYDDQGEPSNLEDVMTALLEAKPILKGTPSKPKAPNTNAGDGGAGVKGPELTAAEREMAQQLGMSEEAYAAYKQHGATTTLADYQRLREKQAAATT